MKKAIFILTLLVALSLSGQELPRIVPPSPNAASLGVFGEVPIGSYNGTANVSIPIYEVKSGSLSVPITLSYHTSGIRVSQDASWAGLGWALNAGGVITRTVIGQEDFRGLHNNGYIDSDPIPFIEPEHYLILAPDQYAENNYYSPQEISTYIHKSIPPDPLVPGDVQPPLFDSHPDKFTFNFGGYSGSMMFGKDQADNNALKPTLFKKSDLDITYYRNEKKWIVKDELGNTYHFEAKESSAPYSYNGGSKYDESKESWLKPDYDGGVMHTNAWYLSYIISPNNDRIDFEYDTDIQSSKSVVSLSEYKEQQIDINNNGCDGHNDPANCIFQPVGRYGASMTVTDDIYLKKITTTNCTVDFYTSDRNDIERYDTSLTKAQKLDSIVVNNNQKVHSRYEFVHNVTHTKNDRLVLNELRQTADNDIKAHKFTYNSTSLPSKLSYQVDCWGFYNGATSNRELKSEISLIQRYFTHIDKINRYPGADRKPNVNFAQAQILTDVEYPTGGKTQFIYESNEYSNFKPYQDVVEADDYINLGGISTNKSEIITFSEDAFFKIDLESERQTPSNGNCYYVYNSPRGKLEKLNPDLTVDTNTPVEYFWPNDINTDTTSEVCDAYMYSYYKNEILLSPGTYRMTAYMPTTELETENIVLSYSYVSRSGPIISTKEGGGIRVKEVVNYDSDNAVLSKKTYDYTFEDENGLTKSSGILMSPLGKNYLFHNYASNIPPYSGIGSDFSFDFTLIKDEYQDQGVNNILVRSSRSYVPMSFSANGNPVGYSQVTETNIDRTDASSNGKIIHYFENEKDYYELLSVPNTPSIPNLTNGNLKKVAYYNDSDILVQEKSFIYSANKLEWIPGISIFKTKNYPWMFFIRVTNGEVHPVLVDKIDINLYEYPSVRTYLTSEITTSYDTNGQNPITTSSKYFHGSSKHLQVTGTKTTVSDGKTIETKTLYPDDIKTASTLQDDSLIDGGTLDIIEFNAIDRMKQDDLHQVATPVQVKTTVKDGTEIVSQTLQRTNYYEPFTNIILPKELQTLKGPYNSSNNILENRIVFDRYDNQGNPIEVSKADGSHIYYIWGYNKEYPIAKIDNFENSQITTAVQNLINAAVTASDSDDDRCTDLQSCNEKNLRTAFTNLRNNPALSNAMVTTYTYDPLIGVTSMTDPRGYTMYYHYDDFNRLKYIKDAAGKLVSENKYNYKN